MASTFTDMYAKYIQASKVNSYVSSWVKSLGGTCIRVVPNIYGMHQSQLGSFDILLFGTNSGDSTYTPVGN